MFDFAWSEIAVIAVVALVAIGPKDMPVAIRALTKGMKKARRMASEFQSHVDEMVREANLDEVRDQISAIRNFDIKSTIEQHVDPDGALRTTFASDPLAPNPLSASSFATAGAMSSTEANSLDNGDLAVAERPISTPIIEPEIAATLGQFSETAGASAAEPPAFIPPGALTPWPETPAESETPAFIPPMIGRARPRIGTP